MVERNALDPKFINEVEKSVEKEIKQSAMQTIRKLQTELNADVLGFGKVLARKEPKIWEKIENDWDRGKNYFQDAKVNVDVQVTVRFPGLITSVSERR